MSDTKVKIIQAAVQAFTRYGVRRTSMGDVASAAGVSRQTLYSNFGNKDDLLAAAMTVVIDQIMQQLAKAWAQSETAEQVIDAYFEHAVYRPFSIMQQMPELKDLIHGVGSATALVGKQAEREKAKALAQQFAPYKPQLVASGTTPIAVAEFIVRVTNEFKFSATEFGELEGLMKTLKSSVLAMVG